MRALREALLRGKRRPRRSGEGSPTLYRGDGYEFVELREYVTGDDVRRIDWAATARTATLQTRVLLEDVGLTLGVFVDESPSMRVGRKRPLASSAREAAQLWCSAATAQDRVQRVDSFEEALAALPRGSALLVISDWFSLCHGGVSHGHGSQDDLLYQLAHKFDCTGLIARDPWQDDLPLSGFVRIADTESNENALTYIGKRERERYMRASREREARIVEMLELSNWRTGVFSEEDGAAALLAAFGI
jgi:hypothetical protein